MWSSMSYWMGNSVRSCMMRSWMSSGMHWSVTVAKMRVDAVSILVMAVMRWICVMHVIIMVDIVMIFHVSGVPVIM